MSQTKGVVEPRDSAVSVGTEDVSRPGRAAGVSPAAPSGRRMKSGSSLKRREQLLGVALILPVVLVIALLILVPLSLVLGDSFTNRSFIRPVSEFIGLENYTELLASLEFWETLARTGIWTAASVTLQIVIGLCLALLLNQRFRGRGFLRGLYLLPWVTPVVVVALIWKWMLNDLYGIINSALSLINPAWQDLSWFSDEALALPTVIGINVWRGVPFTMVIFLAGLQTVPRDLVEAAAIDGANAIKSFRHVTLPHLRAILLVVILVFTLFNFSNFDLIYLATQGGPLDLTMTMPVKTYEVAFKGLAVGEASAWAMLTLITILILAFIYASIVRRSEREER